MADRLAWGVLRSALFSQSSKVPAERRVTWTAHNTRLETVFTGGIIYIANADLRHQPEIDALMQRLPVVELTVGDDEIKSMMYRQAERGYRHGCESMTADECLQVTDYMLARVQETGRALDMRLQKLCLNTYLQCRSDGMVWEDQVDTLISRRTEYHPVTRAGRVTRQQELAHEISRMKISQYEKLKIWADETGTSIRTYYRMLQRQ